MPLFRRQVLAAWVIGGGLWLAGMAGLGLHAGAATVAETCATDEVTTAAFLHTGSWSTYQTPSGKYTVTVRSVRPAARLG